MHSLTDRRLPLAALLALAGLTFTAPAADAKPTGQGACTRTTDPQTRTVEFRYLFQQTRQRRGERPNGTPWPVQVRKRQRGSLGSMTFEATACKTPKGGWKLLKPQSLAWRSSGARADHGGVVNGEWQIGLASATEGPQTFLSMRMLSCTRGSLFTGMRLLVGVVPLPQLKFASGIAKWAIGQALPNDKRRCGDYGTVDMSFDVNADGQVVVGPNTTNTLPNQYVRTSEAIEQRWTYSITDPIVR